jgi:transposase
MKDAAAPFAAYVGIDWADQEHAVCVATPDGSRYESNVVTHKAEALERWAQGLRAQFGGRPVAVCLEQSHGALAFALRKYEFLVLFPINPKQLARFREAFAPSGAKSDPDDARLLAEFVRQYHPKLRAWRPDDVQTRQLALLVEARRTLVDDRKGLENRLRQTLKESFPQALELDPGALHCDWFLRLLRRFPTLARIQRVAPQTLARVLPRRRRRGEDEPAIDPRIAQLRAAQPLVTDRAVLEASRLMVAATVAQIVALNAAIEEHDGQIAELMAEHPDAALFRGLPGAGAAMAPRLLAAFGSDRERYASAEDLQRYSGIAPVTQQSGRSHSVHRRRACPKFLRQTFHEFADHSRKASAWARAFYDLQRQRNKGHHAALRSLAFKWLRILFQCWRTRTAYDEQRYLQQLRKTNSPLLACLPKPAAAS